METLLKQAREWESSGEYARAVDCFMKVTPMVTNDDNLMAKSWMRVRGGGLC